MKTAIMQPYIFPYIGYFQLISAVDTFVFYDDVNYIKRGWINRNQILVNNQAHLFSIPLKSASQNKLINEVELGLDEKWLNNFYATLEQNYKKAPYYITTLDLIKKIFNLNHNTISDLAITSITSISNHIGISTVFELSSQKYSETKGIEKADRLIEITKLNKSNIYINPAGGKELYHKDYFNKKDVDLFFIDSNIVPYKQFNNTFEPFLSIIDVLMFNSKNEIKKILTEFTLT